MLLYQIDLTIQYLVRFISGIFTGASSSNCVGANAQLPPFGAFSLVIEAKFSLMHVELQALVETRFVDPEKYIIAPKRSPRAVRVTDTP